MKSPSSEKRHAPSDASSLLESVSFSNAIKIVFFATTLVFLFSASPAYAQSGPIIVGDNTVGCTGANAGGLRYVTASNILQYCNGSSWTTVGSGGGTPAGGDREIQFNNGGSSFGASSTFKLMSDGDLLLTGTHTGTASVPVTGVGTRMFFDTQMSAFRAGAVTAGWPDVWDNANVGEYSIALGRDVEAKGIGSVSIGRWVGTYANPSYAFGYDIYADGQYSMVLGYEAATTSSAPRSIAISAANSSPNYPQISGNGSIAFFMGDQTNVDVTASGIMTILGGNVGIGTTSPGATLTVNGSIATTPPSIINMTADNTLVTTAGRSYIRLTSNNTTATNRTFCLDAGTEGQILVLEWTSGTNKGELVDDGTSCASSVAAKLSATWTPAAADATLQLIYRAATPQKWLELSRSAN